MVERRAIPSSLRLTAAGEDMRQLALRLRDEIAARWV
jgi:hypothetical protein